MCDAVLLNVIFNWHWSEGRILILMNASVLMPLPHILVASLGNFSVMVYTFYLTSKKKSLQFLNHCENNNCHRSIRRNNQ